MHRPTLLKQYHRKGVLLSLKKGKPFYETTKEVEPNLKKDLLKNIKQITEELEQKAEWIELYENEQNPAVKEFLGLVIQRRFK